MGISQNKNGMFGSEVFVLADHKIVLVVYKKAFDKLIIYYLHVTCKIIILFIKLFLIFVVLNINFKIIFFFLMEPCDMVRWS